MRTYLKYKTLKARTPEVLASMMNRLDTVKGAEHDFTVIVKDEYCYALYREAMTLQEDDDHGRPSEE